MVDEYASMISDSEIFDFCLWWDPVFREGFHTYSDWGTQWEAYMRFGLRRGLVTSAKAARYDAAEGNAELAELIKGGDLPLLGCMVLTPEMFYDRNGEKYIDDLVSCGFSAAKLFPVTYSHSMKPFCVGSLLSALEDRGIPLILQHTQVSLEEMDRLCEEYPGLNIVLEGHEQKLLYHARQYTALLIRHSNFFVETHNLVLYREIETIESLAGCENLLYGSGYPYNTPHCSLYHILSAGITEKQRSGVLCDNAMRIMRDPAAGGYRHDH